MVEAVTFSLCILTGLDLWVSQKRWKQGYADLNPVVQHFVKTGGPTVGLAALASINLLLIAGVSLYLPAATMLLGAKLALAALQIRSLKTNV